MEGGAVVFSPRGAAEQIFARLCFFSIKTFLRHKVLAKYVSVYVKDNNKISSTLLTEFFFFKKNPNTKTTLPPHLQVEWTIPRLGILPNLHQTPFHSTGFCLGSIYNNAYMIMTPINKTFWNDKYWVTDKVAQVYSIPVIIYISRYSRIRVNIKSVLSIT